MLWCSVVNGVAGVVLRCGKVVLCWQCRVASVVSGVAGVEVSCGNVMLC